jgi:Lauroyl/myristoyl acyltransferase
MLDKIGFGLVEMIAYFNAVLPCSLLYVKSDFYYFIVYHIVRYRRSVVRKNLTNSFPEKSLKEIKVIEKKFYRNLCDLVVETCKLMVMKPDELKKHVVFKNPEILQKLYDEHKNVFVAFPHSGNWEWFGKLMHTLSKHKSSAIYKRVENENFERFMYKLRTNYNLDQEQMIESGVALKTLVRRNNMLNSILIVADQSPRGVVTDYWTSFMHQETAWFFGLEKMAKLLNYAVVFVEMKRVKRGFYEVEFKTITESPKETENGFIMQEYVKDLEHFLMANPDNWLWTHRRWKHKKPHVG